MKIICLLVFLSFLVACGKSSISEAPLTPPFSKPTTEFNYNSQYTLKKMKLETSGDTCLTYDFIFSTTYPEISNSFDIEGHLYRPKKSGFKAPIVVLFPPVGGKNILDESMAETFCENNIAVFLPTNDFTGIDQDDPPPVQDHDHALRRVTAATKTFIKYSKKHYRLNGDKVGIFGASLGGIVGTFAMGVLPEVSAGYFIVAGGDVPYILAHSTQERVIRLKKIRKQQVGFRNDKEYEAWLRTHLNFDPLDYAKNIPSEMVQMVISSNDESVPTTNQWELHDALRNPAYYISTSNHFWTVVNSMSGNTTNITDFFIERFDKNNSRQPVN